jgi:hypothetical protein
VPDAERSAISGIGHRFFSWILRWQVVPVGSVNSWPVRV